MKRVTALRQEGFDPEFPATDPGDVCRLHFLVEEVSALLNMPEVRQRLGANAREFAVRHYDLNSVCLPRQLEWVDDLAQI